MGVCCHKEKDLYRPDCPADEPTKKIILDTPSTSHLQTRNS